MKKTSPLKDAKRFSRELPHLGIRLWCKDDGTAAKITACNDLTPEQMIEAAAYLKSTAGKLKKIREDGSSNKTGRALLGSKR